MASVNLKGGDTWQASIRVWVADPADSTKGEWRRTWRTTGISSSESKASAEKVAEAIQAAALAAGPQNPRRADQRVFTEMLEGIWRAAGIAPPQASSTWRKFSAEHLASGNRSPKTAKVLRSRIKSFTEWLGKRADDMLWNLSHEDFRNFQRHLIEGGRANSTAESHMAILSTIMEQAFLRSIIPRNPVKLAKASVTVSAEDRESRKPFTAAEIATLLQFLDSPPAGWIAPAKGSLAEWKTATLLGLCCGLRLSDATGRRWQDFDLAAGTVALIPSKKAKKRRTIVLPMAAPLLRHMRSLVPGGEWVTPSIRENDANSTRFCAILESAGIDTEISHRPDPKSAGKSIRLKTFHSLRHTLLTMLAAAGTEKQLRMLISDHDDPRVNDRYTHGTVERLGAELAKVFPEDADA